MQQNHFLSAKASCQRPGCRCRSICIRCDQYIRFWKIALPPLCGRSIPGKPYTPAAFDHKGSMVRGLSGCADMPAGNRCYRNCTNGFRLHSRTATGKILRTKNDPAFLPFVAGSKVGVIMIFMGMGKGDNIRKMLHQFFLYLRGCDRVGFYLPAHTVH